MPTSIMNQEENEKLFEKPINFASRSLNEAEQQYAQIEKEMLAIRLAAKKFRNYIYGKKVIVWTDHTQTFTYNYEKENSRYSVTKTTTIKNKIT